MAPRNNPLKLNNLQLKTLTLVQEIARDPDFAEKDVASGDPVIKGLPHAHGNHFHLGAYVVAGKDATGLHNPAVWTALERKGLVRQQPSGGVLVTEAGMAYETGLRDQILHGSDH